jgi:hypothetical protein
MSAPLVPPAFDYSLEDRFTMAQMKSQIEQIGPHQLEDLKKLAASLVEGFMLQRAASRWMAREAADALGGQRTASLKASTAPR